MKKLILVSLMALLCSIGFGQTVLKGENNRVMGYVEDGNKFYDLNSQQILDFSTDGEIKNISGDLMATYNRTTGQVKDLNGDLLFSFDGSTLKSANNVTMGSVDDTGNLKDDNNHVLGNAEDVDKYYLAFFILVYNRI